MKIKVGISNRHIHLTKQDYELLFDEKIENINNLYQPEEYKSNQKVTIKTNKNEIKDVRLIGPLRDYTQVEISKTDAYFLGLNPPVRESGDLENSEEITIETPKNKITKKCCIISQRHIHISKEEQKKYNLYKPTYKIKINGQKPGILENVHLKVSNNYKLELHIDTDEANAFLINQNDELDVVED